MKLNKLKLSATALCVMALVGCNEESTQFELSFATVPTDGTTAAFEMGTTEVPNQVYVNFLNEAYAAGLISVDTDTGYVTDNQGNKLTDLNGYRVVDDHNSDKEYTLDEMENPLNINYIDFDNQSKVFTLEDPASIDWYKYFDDSKYPNVVDSATDWFEFDGDETTFHGEGDQDGLMPTLAEIELWPANFITYSGAKAFADFYGYKLPTLAQWRLAAAADQNFEYATSNGTADEGIAWINVDGPVVRHRGHVQPVNSKEPNPLGIYHLGGNVWEWVADWYNGTVVFDVPQPTMTDIPSIDGAVPPTTGVPPTDGELPATQTGPVSTKLTEDFFIDEAITIIESKDLYLKGLIGGSFNYFPATMLNTWNHAANPITGNDHFGFRVAK